MTISSSIKDRSKLIKFVLLFSLVFIFNICYLAADTIFSDNFGGSYPGAWTIGHDGGEGIYAWAWPNGYVHCYAEPSGSMHYYPNNLHVYMERRNVNLSGYNGATLSFLYAVDTESGYDKFTVNVRDQYGIWHQMFEESGSHELYLLQKNINLNQFAGQTGLYIQFRFDSDGSISGSDGPYNGVYIDNIVLTAVNEENPNPDLVSVSDIPTSITFGDSFTMTVSAENDGGTSPEGYISVSFTNNPSLSNMSGSGLTFAEYAPGSLIYDRYGNTMTAQDRLLDAMDTNWSIGESHTMSATVTPHTGTMFIYVRATLKDNDSSSYYSDWSVSNGGGNYTDQQGWTCRRFTVNVISDPIPTIQVTSPNGGESILMGSTYLITWGTSGEVGNVKIQYTTNGGDTWQPITNSTANDGSYQWVVPNTPSSNCKIKISEASDGNPTDESDSAFSIVPTTHTLYINSTPETGVNITVTPDDIDSKGSGTTNFTRTYDSGTEVTLTAPAIHNGKNFQKWLVDNADRTDRAITVTMDSDHTAQAVYQASTYTLTVQSSPDTGASITVTPNDNNDQGSGNTQFFRTYDYGTIANLTAPASHNGKNFVKWLIDGVENTNRTIQVTMKKNHTAQAVFQSPTYVLTVQSSPYSGVGITVSPTDNNGNGDGNTNFTRTYDSGKAVSLTAPSSFSGSDFIKWAVDGKDYSSGTIQFSMDSNHTAVAYYETSSPPEISVNRTSLNFGYIVGSNNIPKESFIVYNSGGGTLNWTASCELWRVTLSPGSGTNYGVVEVIFDLDRILPQKIKKDVIYVSDPLVANSPVEIKLNVWVKTQSESSPPFGAFSTPLDGSIVRSSIPVTGWALGDTGIESVKIYREEGKSLVYIGEALLVEGARPDVEAAYPDYPMNYKSGWGYMMLTNFLPNGGNGTYRIHAIATDKEGRTTTLGIKTITVDNANAAKPFGAIDTPTQGGTASGSSYVNWGWVLTPQPNKIPTDGLTIDVYVDGAKLGHPTYNIYREDIANLFPDYANSGGAAGYFYLDTTPYKNGVHTIYWTATDNNGNTDGIGSRYFTTQNTGGVSSQQSLVNSHWSFGNDSFLSVPVNYNNPVIISKGHQPGTKIKEIYPDENGIITVEIRELEILKINLGHLNCIGYQLIKDQLKPPPIGSFMDTEKGVFHWQPGAGFYGIYNFIFIKTHGNQSEKFKIRINILPKQEVRRKK